MDISQAGSYIKDFDPNYLTIKGDEALILDPDSNGTNGYSVAFFNVEEEVKFVDKFENNKTYYVATVLKLNNDQYYKKGTEGLAKSEGLNIIGDGAIDWYDFDELDFDDDYTNAYYLILTSFSTGEGFDLDYIEITNSPDKTVYNIGDKFEPTGMTVEATYSAKEMSEDILETDFAATKTEEIPVEDCTFTPETFTTTGIQDVIVSYTYDGITKSDTVEVTVNESGNTPSDNPGQTSVASSSSGANGSNTTSTSTTSDMTPIALIALFSVVSAAMLIAFRKKMQ